MRRQILYVTLPVCLAIVVAGTWLANAGNLNPPAGPVTSTMKTLAEVEPRTAVNAVNTPGDAGSAFKITQPGSYYLTGNITGVSGKIGIEIAANGVTLNLMGFELGGVPGALDGVSAAAGVENVAVRNGTVRDWPQSGVNFSNATGGCVSDLIADQNSGNGIFVFDAFLVRACCARRNGVGIKASRSSTVSDCFASANTDTGIHVGLGGGANVVRGCVASMNSTGIFAIGAAVTDCSARENGASGIRALEGSTVAHCSASYNGADGISAEQSTVVHCAAIFNSGDGIDAQDCLVQSNTAVSNTGVNIRTTNSTALDNHGPP